MWQQKRVQSLLLKPKNKNIGSKRGPRQSAVAPFLKQIELGMKSMELPKQVQWILHQLEQNGFEGYAVGGCVRDTLLGKAPNDWDLCTSALPEQVKQCFGQQTILDTGLAHGTVTLVLDHQPYEITTYRVDGSYADHRRPEEVRFVSELRQDLARRDFTINAMACGLDGVIQDPFGGRQDLENRIVRCVGAPSQRFEEDALRILRALRFAAVLEFAVEPNTLAAARERSQELRLVSAERIFAELNKLLCGTGAGPILKQCGEVLLPVLPEIGPCMGFGQQNPCHDRDVWTHTIDALAAAPPQPELRWALLLHDLSKPECFTVDAQGVGHFPGHPQKSAAMAHGVFRRLKAEKKLEQQVCQLIEFHDANLPTDSCGARRWLNKLGEEQLLRLIAMKKCDIAAHTDVPKMQGFAQELKQFEQQVHTALQQKDCFRLEHLAVNGRDLQAAGIPAGPVLGKLLQTLLEQVMEEQVPNERQALLVRAKELQKQ